jgi:hypothetical protein
MKLQLAHGKAAVIKKIEAAKKAKSFRTKNFVIFETPV